jgi:hypothetical protein
LLLLSFVLHSSSSSSFLQSHVSGSG